MSTFRRTTTTTTSSFGRPRTTTTTTTTNHRPASVDGDVLFVLLLADVAANLFRAFRENRHRINELSASQRNQLAVAACKHARNCQNCALWSKDRSQGPSSAQNQTDMIGKALEKAEYAHELDAEVVSATQVRNLRELSRNVASANRFRVIPSTCFKHTAIG
jgi:hypothetical protein